MPSLIVMGVAGCGKSSLARAIAEAQGLPLIEGDDHHSAVNRARMAQGIALTDADRQDWLATLGRLLPAQPQGAASPGLRFAFLDITRAAAAQRVAARSSHFFSASLVDSQFATLESPLGEPGVLRLDAELPLGTLQRQVQQWLQQETTA